MASDAPGTNAQADKHAATEPSTKRHGAASSHCSRHRAATAARLIQAGERFDAAHIIDGAPEHGWKLAHPHCNQRAKSRS